MSGGRGPGQEGGVGPAPASPPAGDLVLLSVHRTGHSSHRDCVPYVLHVLAQVGAPDGDPGASMYVPSQWLHLAQDKDFSAPAALTLDSREAAPTSHLWALDTKHHTHPQGQRRGRWPAFQHTERIRGAGHWVATAPGLPQAFRAVQRGCTPMHHTQSYWGLAVWQRLQSWCPTEQSYSTTGEADRHESVSGRPGGARQRPQPPQLTMQPISTVHAQTASPAQKQPHTELWLQSLVAELERRGWFRAGLGRVSEKAWE